MGLYSTKKDCPVFLPTYLGWTCKNKVGVKQMRAITLERKTKITMDLAAFEVNL